MAEQWKRLSRRWKALAAAAAIALLAIVPLQLATADETGTPANPDAGFTIERGDIVLKMKPDADVNGKSYFRYGDAVQKFKSTGRCGYAVISGDLVSVTAEGGSVGYREADNGYGLGVSKGGTEGTGSCTQTNPGETLTLDFDPGLGSNEFVDHALLDLELKYTSTLVTIELYRDGTTGPVYTYTRTCTSSDCGPDSGGSDNRTVRVPTGTGTVLFDRMTITTSANGGSQAAATLEGGSDPGTSPSTFHVVTPAQPIDCNESVTDSGDGTHVTVTLTGEGCEAKAYTLDASAREIELITGGGDVGQWVVDVDDWSPETAVNPVPASRVFPPDPNGELVVWCNGTYDKDDLPSEGGTYGASMPTTGDHSWCLIRQDASIAGDGLMQVNEILLLEADARITRG